MTACAKRFGEPRRRRPLAGVGLAAAALLFGLAATDVPEPAEAAGVSLQPVTFALGRVEDRYAINLPGFRGLFRLLDIGYAGCSIVFEIGVDRDGLGTDANRKIEVTVDVELYRPAQRFTTTAVGSLERPEFEIYLANKCPDVERVAISAIRCYAGQHDEFAGMPCPYRFEPGAYAIRRFYLRQGPV